MRNVLELVQARAPRLPSDTQSVRSSMVGLRSVAALSWSGPRAVVARGIRLCLSRGYSEQFLRPPASSSVSVLACPPDAPARAVLIAAGSSGRRYERSRVCTAHAPHHALHVPLSHLRPISSGHLARWTIKNIYVLQTSKGHRDDRVGSSNDRIRPCSARGVICESFVLQETVS